MFLKEIELENFKSFGRRLRLPILSGYTAITGPNGGGKSNIGDAVIFVLGPKSSRVIRAGRLTDLIYDGGHGGKPADYCRVSLVFDNEDRTIPLEANEVRLTRYVGRSKGVKDGYNSYFYVNGRKATLADFDTLLANAKISADGYNIVQQGDVQGIVEMTPLERRRVLENIAGISRFDEDIQRAERKRGGVEEDLDRIEIILKEIRRLLGQLER
ncbi:MAG: AAA family ATPase, partial [Thermoplasmata archaeon]